MDFTMAILTHPIQMLLVGVLVAQIARQAVSGLARAAGRRSTVTANPERIPATFPLRVLAAVLCSLLLAGSAFATEPPRPSASNVTPRYPRSAVAMTETEETVKLQVVVDADGTVRDPRVVEGAEPFATAALNAVKRWRYAPARDGDQAIALSWEIRVHFQLPPKASDRWQSYRRAPSTVRIASATPVVAPR